MGVCLQRGHARLNAVGTAHSTQCILREYNGGPRCGATAIQAGISNNAVFRLKKTHDALKPDVQALKNELEDHLTECTHSEPTPTWPIARITKP